MADKAVHQIISGYASGCLDKENFIQFRNYILENDDLPKGELGELQNIISLIPMLLDIDKPPDSLKPNLLNRIYEMEEKATAELKHGQTTQKSFVIPATSGREPKEVEITGLEKTTTREQDKKKQTYIDDPILSQTQTGKEKTKIKSERLHDIDKHETPKTKVVETKPHHYLSHKGFSALPWLLAGVFLVILIVVTIYFNNANNSLNDEIASIKSQLAGFQNEIASTNQFVNDHVALIEFFNHKNVEIVNFQGSDINLDASGKLLISFEAGEGLLQLKNTAPLSSNEAFQLWMVSKNESYSLGTIIARPDIEYYSITNIPFLKKEEIRMFRITKESREGAEIPQGITYLFGVFSTEKVNSRGRR